MTNQEERHYARKTKAQLIDEITENHRLIGTLRGQVERLTEAAEEHSRTIQSERAGRKKDSSQLKAKIVELSDSLSRALGYIDRINEADEPIVETQEIRRPEKGPKISRTEGENFMHRSYGRSEEKPSEWYDKY